MTPAGLLVGDFGGTNVRLALARADGAGGVMLSHIRRAPATDYESPEAALSHWLAASGAAPAGAVLAAAGPVANGRAALTNSPWVLDEAALTATLGLPVRVHNDFVAMARAAPLLAAGDVETLLDGAGVPDAPIVVLGPGTGLGMAILTPNEGLWRVVATEAGHQLFAPSDARERKLLAALTASGAMVTAEMLVSGTGLARLYTALGGRGQADAPAIGQAALHRSDPIAVEAAEVLTLILAAFARDAVLAAGARGGCVIAGGVADALSPLLKPAFEARFRKHPAMAHYLEPVPVSRMLDPMAALKGAALLQRV